MTRFCVTLPTIARLSTQFRKWCGGLPYANNQARYWNIAGRLTLKLATLMHCEWAKVGHTGMAVLRKPMTS